MLSIEWRLTLLAMVVLPLFLLPARRVGRVRRRIRRQAMEYNADMSNKITETLGINGVLVDYEGRNNEQGVYRAYLSREGAEIEAQDFVQTSIERFVKAARREAEGLLATAADGLGTLEMQLHLLKIADRV